MSFKNFGEACDALIKAIPPGKEQIVARDFLIALNKELKKQDKEIAALRQELESLKAS
ncbi:hypothetical protein [Ochrobactrum chromiisoli]|uniref:Uncharacterized protein n=1 Tax=Ochrobactrum chromiisoli TaxID=2993941 RepID=A0ABT3QM82_9HYPH|nr:hypothetical protein [Ochrobactrum chromiisoli]MCX2696723.1 hypothetical protein [Ochrobactrum chromiisoli]